MYVIATTILMVLAGAGDRAATLATQDSALVALAPTEFESCPGITTPLRALQLAFGVSGRPKSVVGLRAPLRMLPPGLWKRVLG